MEVRNGTGIVSTKFQVFMWPSVAAMAKKPIFWTLSLCLRGHLCHFLLTHINEIWFENPDIMYLLACQIWS